MLELTILMPCLNEVKTVGRCIEKAKRFLKNAEVQGEILISDNGSSDGSQDLARSLGARVVEAPQKGYGAALSAGIAAARGKFIIMGDSDDSYDFENLGGFLAALRSGSQLVMGNRFAGGIAPGAMPLHHKYLGNPVLSFVGRLFFKSPVRDFHCGLRGFDRNVIQSLELESRGMEFASEMVVRATLNGLSISEVPTTLQPDGRGRPPHLRSWRDGWRHLKFLFLLSPRWLFFYPGIFLTIAGLVSELLLFKGPLFVRGIGLDIHTMLYGAGAAIVGYQMLSFALFAKVLGASRGLLPHDSRVERFLQIFTIDRGLVLGLSSFVIGILIGARSVSLWGQAEFGEIDPAEVMRYVIPSVTLSVLGVQLMLTSTFLGILELGTRKDRE